MLNSPTSLLRVSAPRMIGQNHAHDFGREGVEVSAISPVSFFLRNHAQTHFIDQVGRLEFSGIPLSSYVGGGHFTQVGVDERHQLLEGRRLTVSPLCQEQSDLSLGWLHKRLHRTGTSIRVAGYPTIFLSTLRSILVLVISALSQIQTRSVQVPRFASRIYSLRFSAIFQKN
jgi:hypothetical protein